MGASGFRIYDCVTENNVTAFHIFNLGWNLLGFLYLTWANSLRYTSFTKQSIKHAVEPTRFSLRSNLFPLLFAKTLIVKINALQPWCCMGAVFVRNEQTLWFDWQPNDVSWSLGEWCMCQLENSLRKVNFWGERAGGGREWWKQTTDSQHGNAAPKDFHRFMIWAADHLLLQKSFLFQRKKMKKTLHQQSALM